MLRIRHLVSHALDRGVILGQLRLQLGNFENCHKLTFRDAGSVVDQQLFYIARFFDIDIDLLKRDKFGRDGELPLERAPGELRYTDGDRLRGLDRKSTRLNSSHMSTSYAVFCLKK